MHAHLRAAAVAALILLPYPASAQATPNATDLRPGPAYLVIDRLIAQRSLLSLDSAQVANLTALKQRLSADKGRLKRLPGSRVPGKSVPVYVRVFPTSDEARRLALDLLTPEQRAVATGLLQAPEPGKIHADTTQQNSVRG